MAENQSLKFYRVSTLPVGSLVTGGVYFDHTTGTIHVATGASSSESYGGIVNATFANRILTIYKGDGSEITLDFTDTASAEGVQSLIAVLRTDINQNKTDISAEAARAKAAEGTLTSLTTTAKDNLVAAINEVDAQAGVADTNISNLQGLHATGTHNGKMTVAEEVAAGIDGIAEVSKSNASGSDVVVTVTTEDGSVKSVAVDDTVLAGKVSENTTAISANTSAIATLNGDANTTGSVKKAVADEAALRVAADNALDTRLDVIEGADDVDGSIAKALKDAKDYTDGRIGNLGKVSSESDAADHTVKSYVDAKISAAGTDTAALAERVTDNENAIATLNGGAGVEGSVQNTVDEAIAGVISGAPAAFDTLKEIADWIGSGEAVENTTAAKMLADIATLKGDENTEGSVAKAAADALADANDYTDGKIAIVDTAIDDEETARIAADNALDERLDVIEGDATQAGSIKKALADAEAYTDAEIDKLDATINNAATATTAGSAASTQIKVEVTEEDGVLTNITVSAPAFETAADATSQYEDLQTAITAEATARANADTTINNLLGAANAAAGDTTAFARIKALEDAKASGDMMWSAWN